MSSRKRNVIMNKNEFKMMIVDIFTTDVSAFGLLDRVPNLRIGKVYVPENRQNTEKVLEVRSEATRRDISVCLHKRGVPISRVDDEADLALSWFYSQILPQTDLGLYRAGAMNMHGGKIPEYRGSNVLQWAIINGEQNLGVTWHEMVEDVDAGMIWAESMVPCSADATATEMRKLLLDRGLQIFPEALANKVSLRGVRRPDLSEGKVWPQRRPQDGEIQEGMSFRELRDLCRALCGPWPSAFIWREGKKVEVTAVSTDLSVTGVRYKTRDAGEVTLICSDRI